MSRIDDINGTINVYNEKIVELRTLQGSVSNMISELNQASSKYNSASASINIAYKGADKGRLEELAIATSNFASSLGSVNSSAGDKISDYNTKIGELETEKANIIKSQMEAATKETDDIEKPETQSINRRLLQNERKHNRNLR